MFGSFLTDLERCVVCLPAIFAAVPAARNIFLQTVWMTTRFIHPFQSVCEHDLICLSHKVERPLLLEAFEVGATANCELF
jgi:hypothetical protein